MAIAYDTFSQSNNAASWSHTCTGTNQILFVAVEVYSGSTQTITGIKYNNVSLTKISEISQSANGANLSLWYLLAPSTGSNTIAVTGTGSFDCVGVSYTGVSQSGFPDGSHNDITTNAASFNSVVTSTADLCWHVAAILTPGPTHPGTGATSRASGLFGNICLYDNNIVIHPAGSNSFTITIDAPFQTGDDGAIGITMAPAGGATASNLGLLRTG